MTWYFPKAEDGFFRCNHARAPPYYLQVNLRLFGAESTKGRWSKQDRRRAGSFLSSILQSVNMTCKILSLLWTRLCSYWKSWKHFSRNIRITRLIHNETREEWNRSGIDYVNRLPITPRPTSIIHDSMQIKAIMGVSECNQYSRQLCSAIFASQ